MEREAFEFPEVPVVAFEVVRVAHPARVGLPAGVGFLDRPPDVPGGLREFVGAA